MGIPTPNHRPTRPFAGAGAAAGRLLSQFPLRPITNAALEGKGSLEIIGFKRRFLLTFCRCRQKACRRRQTRNYCWEKWAVGGTGPTKEKHPSERKRKPAKRERIPTTSLRTGLGMTGLAYERIFGGPIKPVPFCVNPFSTVEWRPFRRKEKIVLAFCRRGIYNSIKSIKGQSVRRLVRRRRNRVRSPASWSL